MKRTFYLKTLMSLFLLFVGMNVWAQKVTLTLTDDGWGFPSDAYVNTETSYTNGDYTIKMIPGTGGSGWKLNVSNGTVTAFLFGKTGAALQLPAFDFAVSKIVVNGPASGASGKVTFNVFAGADAASTEVTGANGTNEFAIADSYQTAGTVYTIKNTNSNNNQIVSIQIYKASSVKAPTFSVKAGTYTSAQTVELACETEGADIYYTLDGTDPTAASAKYESALTISETTTVKAIAIKDEESSTVESATYTIVTPTGDGTKANPYTVADVKLLNNPGTKAWVTGPVYGVYNNNKPTTEVGTVTSNIALGEGDDIIPVALPAGEVRSALNLVDNTWLTGKTVTVYGDLASYFSTTGVKNTSEPTRFTATGKDGKVIKNKYTSAPLTVVFNLYQEGITVKVDGEEATYNATTGVTLATPAANKNTTNTISIYNNDDLIAEQSYTYVPTVSTVSSVKTLADDVEFCLSTTNSNQVTYITADGKNAYLEDGTRGILASNLGLKFTAFKKFNGGYIWAKKTTVDNIPEMIACDSTYTSTMAMGTTDFTLKTKTVAQTLLEVNQLDYVKIASAQLAKDGDLYYAVSGSDKVVFNDKFATGALSALETTPCYADVYAIISTDADGNIELLPIKLENISDNITGTYSGVTWTIAMDGELVFTPTNGVSGQLGSTSTAASYRPWKDYATMVKTVRFDAGVSSNKQIDYMFADMTNLESVDFTNFNTDAATSAKSLFSGCTNLKSADLSGLNLAGLTSLTLAFANCSSLESVNLGDNDFAAVTDFSSMFSGCTKLAEIDLHAATGAAATKVGSMFNGCTALDKVDLRNFSTAGVTYKTSTRGTVTDNGANFFGSATPSTLILSKNFGLYATSHYITLPATYIAVDADGKFLTSNVYDSMADLYAYNSTLDDYGTYISNVKATVSDAGYATFVAPFNINTIPSGVTVYAAKKNIDSIHLESVEAVPAGTAVILKNAGTYSFVPTADEVTLGAENDLKATTSSIVADGSQYILAQVSGVVGFHKVTTGTTIAAGKGYLVFDDGGAAKSFYTFEEGTETSIDAVESTNASGAIYNIAGQRIAQPQKGINIINGKKYIVK